MPFQPDTAIDLSRYVALGDSITSGYCDGALYYEGQVHSYANLLSGQFKLCGGGEFKQPLMNPDSSGVDMQGHSRLSLERKAGEPGVLLLTHASPTGDSAALLENNYKEQGPYHNMGVPGAKAITAVAPGFGNPAHGPGNYNPFFTRMASNPVTASMLSDVLLMDPTFFTLFIGNNDALAYALSGGTENKMSAPGGPAGAGFEGSLQAILAALTAKGARGVIASLPSIAHIPYFTAIPYNGLLLSAEGAKALNQKHAAGSLRFSEGKNPFLVNDFITQPGQVRQAEKGELILLDLILDKRKDDYLLGREAIPKKYTLTAAEAAAVEATILAYNAIIRSQAAKHGLGFTDIHGLVQQALPDRHYNPATLSLDYQRRGVFSLDGLHPNAFGQALLANEFIRAINAAYHTSIPSLPSHRYPGIVFPKATQPA